MQKVLEAVGSGIDPNWWWPNDGSNAALAAGIGLGSGYAQKGARYLMNALRGRSAPGGGGGGPGRPYPYGGYYRSYRRGRRRPRYRGRKMRRRRRYRRGRRGSNKYRKMIKTRIEKMLMMCQAVKVYQASNASTAITTSQNSQTVVNLTSGFGSSTACALHRNDDWYTIFNSAFTSPNGMAKIYLYKPKLTLQIFNRSNIRAHIDLYWCVAVKDMPPSDPNSSPKACWQNMCGNTIVDPKTPATVGNIGDDALYRNSPYNYPGFFRFWKIIRKKTGYIEPGMFLTSSVRSAAKEIIYEDCLDTGYHLHHRGYTIEPLLIVYAEPAPETGGAAPCPDYITKISCKWTKKYKYKICPEGPGSFYANNLINPVVTTAVTPNTFLDTAPAATTF